LIVTAMGASTGIFNEAEVAVMVAVVLLTTLITPLVMRGAFAIHCPQDAEEPNSNENAEELVDASKYSMIEVQAKA
jgi:Kef-type K+ transport system membrane component KefB